MTVAISDGILGLEATVRIGGSYVINDLESGLPRIKLTSIPGLHSLPDADDVRESNVGFVGETVYPSYPRGKTNAYNGMIQCLNQSSLAATRQSFRGATADRSNEILFEHIPNVAYGTHVWGYYGRVLANDIDEEIPTDNIDEIPSPYQRKFTLSVRMSDPRYFLVDESFSSTGNASGATVVADNLGNAHADPTFVVHGLTAGDQVDITNADVNTSDGTARLRFTAIADGDLHVVFGKNSYAYIDNGVDPPIDNNAYSAAFDSLYSQWWDELIPGVIPGNNSLSVVAPGASSWDVSFLYRSW
jgi:hypothetical protein